MMSDCSEIIKQVSEFQIKGFLHEREAALLYAYARNQSQLGPALEIGSYCGKSTVFLGKGYEGSDFGVYAVDHHRGSEEHQVGELYHDPSLWDSARQRMNTFTFFSDTLKNFHLEQRVLPVIASSEWVAKNWGTKLAMVFVDGGHSEQAAQHDVLVWSKYLLPGGVLAIHDIYANEREGGQAPKNALLAVIKTGAFYLERKTQSLVMLRRKHIT